MKRITLFACLYGVLCFCNATSSSFKWSKSYTLKAVLTVPAANLSEPYQVWLDGDTGRSRVDFYGGMDKMYRQWNDDKQQYNYYKIHPEQTVNFGTKEVCDQVSADAAETKMYAVNTYLPVKRFKYSHKEVVNSVEAHKWVYEYDVRVEQMSAKVVYAVWVTFDKASPSKTAIPVRYVYELRIGDKLLDNFQHDYSYFDGNKPDESILQKPLGLPCESLRYSSFHEPIDPLVEFIEPLLENSRVTKAFEGFKTKHKKKYTDENEHFKRMNIFKDNLRFINSLNRQHRSFSVGVNHLADLNDEEISVLLGTKHMKKHDEQYEGSGGHSDDVDDDDDIEGDDKAKFDWRDYGAITPVKDQTALCGACYAFTSAAAIESTAYIARGCKYLDEVSAQAIMDCSWASPNDADGNLGCSGGSYEYTLHWATKWGVPLTSEYGPYLAQEGVCHYKNMSKLVKIDGYIQLQKKKRIIKKYIKTIGPVLAAIDSNLKSFLFYTGGIYNDPKCRTEADLRNHGVTVIGYSKEEDQEYWITKNSFGANWGEKGYMRIATKNNVCGVKNFPVGVSFVKNNIENCKNQFGD